MKEIATYIAEELKKEISLYRDGSIYEINYDEADDTLYLSIEFNGWYEREKIIDILYNSFSIGGYTFFTDTREVRMTFKKNSTETTHVCDIKIKWVNYAKGETVPDEMKNLLSGVSFAQYEEF